MVLIVLLFSSCEKTEMNDPSKDDGTEVPSLDNGETIDRWGVFLIIDAVMYVENLTTGEKWFYNHFSLSKSRSSLRWGGSIFDIEEIIQDTTTYTFYKPTSYPGNGCFILNGDKAKHYMVHYIGLYTTIIEDPVYGFEEQLISGSARPFSGQVWDADEQTIAIQIQETIETINGEDVRYWTQLKLKKIEQF